MTNHNRITMNIEIDQDAIQRPLNLRERIAIHILLLIFQMIYPAKYSHQVKNALEPLYEAIKSK